MTKLDERPAPAARADRPRSGRPDDSRQRVLGYSLLALLAYVPALLTLPGAAGGAGTYVSSASSE